MPARFDLAIPGDVRFGSGRVGEVPAALTALGVHHVLLVTGRDPHRADAVRAAVSAQGITCELFPGSGEPSVDLVRAGVRVAAEAGVDGVLGFGGGSALDLAKAIAIIAGNGSDPLDHLEVIGAGRPFTRPALPCVAVPTTAGTGSEVTRNAVLSGQGSSGQVVKASLRSPLMLPRVALVDPDLLAGQSRDVVAFSGMDALAQLIEPFLSARANPFTDALARDGLRRSARSLRRAVDGALNDDPQVREDLALASLFGGLCLANAGLGAVHGFASVLGGRYGAAHGAVCAALLATTVEVNLRALARRAPDRRGLLRGQELAVLVSGNDSATTTDAVRWLADTAAALKVPGLARCGLVPDDVPAVIADAKRASSMKANPIVLTDEELTEILLRSL